jgi:lipopolysaccharide export system permease protein
MRLLDRYLLRELLIPFGYCLFGFLIFYDSFDLFAQLSTFQKHRLKAGDVMAYYAVKTPDTLVTILPVAFLLALLYSLTDHARHNEITAIRATGVGIFRIAIPYLGVGFLLSLGVFAINETWVPQSLEAAEEIMARREGASSRVVRSQTEEKLGFYFDNSIDRRWWFIESYDLASGGMLRPHVIWIRTDGARTEIRAQGAFYLDATWVFTNGYTLAYEPGPGKVPAPFLFETISMPAFRETPDQIRSEIKIRSLTSFKAARKMQLSLREILDYERLHPGDLSKQAMLDTKLHGRLAAPWTCLVVVLIALPFGAASGRRNAFVGVASSILICFSYFVLQQLALAVGTGGHVLPWVAAWSPNAFFSATGLFLTARMS